MNYATIKPIDVANGTGIRVSLFVSGCTHRCKGCFNAEAWDFNYGRPFETYAKEKIFKSLEPDYIEGFSLLGGEPFEPQNQVALLPFLKELKQNGTQTKKALLSKLGKGIMGFGFNLAMKAFS